MTILEIAQKLIDELQGEELASRHRAEGVVLLYRRLQEEASKPAPAVEESKTDE